jgi:hypothetical protein
MIKHVLWLCLLLLPVTATAGSITTTTCTASVTTGCVTLDLSASSSAGSAVATVSGTWAGTLRFEGSTTSTGTYNALRAYPVGGGSYASETSANGAWLVATEGMVYVRARATSLESGTAVVVLQPSSQPVVPDVVRVVGSTFGEVAVSGTVTLSDTTVSALGPQACTNGRARRLGIGSTPEAVPADLPDGGNGAMPGRTMLLLQDPDANHSIACSLDPGDGGVPDCAVPGFGFTLIPRAPHVALPLGDADRLLCVACTGSSVALEYLERSCAR